ncbi:Uma2 family endonuclease [Candidatus Entotheonella palauensis]|uniref:Uma2 family endonuclease n=1 Tax=Candidatus Entotheonella palauensis TaxID=93172 RepID=UPI000B7DE2E1|nr:Uma2 family endonuclease [Candidatus Entotheonella palauensis]
MALTTAKWTLDDYHRIIDAGILDDRPVELLNGEIVDMSPEGEPHASASADAGEYLMQLLGDRAQVRPAKPITLPNVTSEPEPDLAIVQRLGRAYRLHHPYPEHIFWLIEYANTSLSKDLGEKKAIYADAGIQEYWVVNLREMTVLIFRHPVNGSYQSEEQVNEGIIYPLAFPDIAVSINRLL